MKKLLLVAAGGFLLYTTAKKKQMLDNLEFAFAAFKIHKWDISNPLTLETRLTLNVVNPSNEAQNVQNVFLKLYYKGKFVGLVNQKAEQMIKALATSPMEFAVNLDLQSLVTETFDIVKNKGQLKGLQLQGTIIASGVSLPINQTIDLAAYDPRN